MEHQVRKYEKYKRHVKFLLACSGVWPDVGWQPRFLRKLFSLCSGLATICSFYFVFAFCLKRAASVANWTKGLGLLIGLFSAFMKVCILSSHEKDLQSLNRGISRSFERDLQLPEARKHLLAKFPVFSKFFYFYTYSGAISVIMLAITPLLLLRHGKYARVFPFALPFSYEMGGTTHWLIYVFEVMTGFYLWSVNSGTDSVFGLYSLHMVGELRLLSDKFRSLKSGPNYKRDFKECMVSHYLLLKTRKLLEKVFGFLSISLTITCAVALCALVFQTTEIKHMSVVRICYLIAHCLIKLVQALSYSWYGNIIAVESENCLMSIYDADWQGSGNISFMRDVLLVMSQKPLVFHAKGFLQLRLDTFSKIVHTTASYFCLLQTLEEKI